MMEYYLHLEVRQHHPNTLDIALDQADVLVSFPGLFAAPFWDNSHNRQAADLEVHHLERLQQEDNHQS